ncbi:unnamed protein product [Urochloa humidicola]
MDRPNPKRIAAVAPQLPDDALVEILSRLSAKSLCRFKCVSTAWRDLIAGRLRCTNLPQTFAGFCYFFDGDDNADAIHSNNDSNRNGDDDDDAPVAYGHFIDTLGKPAPLASFSFLGNLPGIQEFGLQQSCNGLLLFTHRRIGDTYNSLGYLVCNPATRHWAAVPSSGWEPDYLYLPEDERPDPDDSDDESNCCFTYLVFDPAVSPHFQLVEFWTEDASTVEEVRTYSSEIGVWCKRTSQWSDESVAFAAGGAFVNGMLHLSATSYVRRGIDHELIVAVDREGTNCRIMRGPEKDADVAFVGQSQGRLHCMNQHRGNTGLSIWVLEEYDTEGWVLKHSVTFLQLFQRRSCRVHFDYSVIAIHPDRNLVFFFQRWDLKLKSYDMDSQEVCTLRTLGPDHQHILPYFPYFAESPALANYPFYWDFTRQL